MSDGVTVYADHNATSPLRPEVRRVVVDAMERVSGNASSAHRAGAEARRAVSRAREEIASFVGADPGEITFTSGGTESDNLAIAGVVGAWRAARTSGEGPERIRLLVGSTDHHAVLRSAGALAAADVLVERIAVDGDGIVDRNDLTERLERSRGDRVLVSIGWVNGETGTLQDVPELTSLARAHGAHVHSDGVQAAGKVPLDFAGTGLDMLSLSAHKLGGPKGIGALVVRSGVSLAPILHGGGHERGLRPGTLDAPSIAGMGALCRLLGDRLDAQREHLGSLTRAFEAAIAERLPSAVVLGGAARAPGTTSVAFPGTSADTLLIALDRAGVCASAGAACTSGATERSHVLEAMNVAGELAEGTIRISFGWSSAAEDPARVIEVLSSLVPSHSRAGGAIHP